MPLTDAFSLSVTFWKKKPKAGVLWHREGRRPAPCHWCASDFQTYSFLSSHRPWSIRKGLFPHFIDNETEAQRHELERPKLTQQGQNWHGMGPPEFHDGADTGDLTPHCRADWGSCPTFFLGTLSLPLAQSPNTDF